MSDSKIYEYNRSTGKLVSPEPADLVSVLKGTEEGHFFAVVLSCEDAIVGVRQLSLDCGSPEVENGASTRIRIVPLNVDSKLFDFAEKLGFTRKSGGHYSIVSNAAATLVNALQAFIEAI